MPEKDFGGQEMTIFGSSESLHSHPSRLQSVVFQFAWIIVYPRWIDDTYISVVNIVVFSLLFRLKHSDNSKKEGGTGTKY